jgi:hypothetical protein
MDFYIVACYYVVEFHPHVGFDLLLPVLFKITIFRETTMRILANSSQSFDAPQCFYLQG